MEAPSPFITWPVWGDCQWTTARSLGMGLFVQNENTAHIYIHSWTSKPMQCHKFTCCTAIPPASLFSQYSQGEQCVGCRPQQPCRLSQSELLPQSRGRQKLRLLVSTHHTNFLWRLRPAVGSVFSSIYATDCLHVLVTMSVSAFWQCSVLMSKTHQVARGSHNFLQPGGVFTCSGGKKTMAAGTLWLHFGVAIVAFHRHWTATGCTSPPLWCVFGGQSSDYLASSWPYCHLFSCRLWLNWYMELIPLIASRKA